MNLKGTMALLLLAVGFGAYIFLVELKKDPDAGVKEKVVDIDTDKVNKLEFKNTFGEFVLEKNDKNEWNVTKPIQDLADSSVVTSILGSFKDEKSEKTITQNLKFQSYGLEPAKIQLTIYQKDKSPVKITLGDETPLPNKLYARVDDQQKVFVTGTWIKSQADKKLSDLREKKIFRGKKEDIESLEIKIQKKDVKGSISVSKKGDGWELLSPLSEKADKDAVQAVLNQLENLRATEFMTETGEDARVKKDNGLDVPEAVVVALGADKKVLETISMSAKKEANSFVKVASRPTIYQVASSMTEVFSKGVDELRDKKGPFEFDKSLVKEIEFNTGLFETKIINKDNTWTLAKDDPKKEVSQMQVSDLLTKLSQLKVNEFLPVQVGKRDLSRKLDLKGSDGKILFSLNWGDKTKTKKYVVKTSKDERVFGVDPSSLDTLPQQTLLKDKGAEEAKRPADSKDPALPFEMPGGMPAGMPDDENHR